MGEGAQERLERDAAARLSEFNGAARVLYENFISIVRRYAARQPHPVEHGLHAAALVGQLGFGVSLARNVDIDADIALHAAVVIILRRAGRRDPHDFAIRPAPAPFGFERGFRFENFLPVGHDPFEIVGVEGGDPVRSFPLSVG